MQTEEEKDEQGTEQDGDEAKGDSGLVGGEL